MSRKLFVTTALPYANGPFHIGHIMEYIQADVWVRFQRMQGHEVHFVCADDTHGAPIMIAAEKAGVSPQSFVQNIASGRKPYLDGFHINFDNWYSTDGEENHTLSRDIYRTLKNAGFIATKVIEQFYDPVKSMFLPDRYIKGECPKCTAKDQYGDSCEICSAVYAPTDLKNPYSVLTGATPILKTSEHFFFTLSDPQCVDFLRKWALEEIDHHPRLQPEIANKAKEWLEKKEGKESGLSDWDISRDAPYFGIEIPDAPGKYFYVWLDAPVGYLAALKDYFDKTGRNFDTFMADPTTEQYHFIGKDIIYFHTLFWPAMLKFSGKKVPNNIFVHGFITVSGEKMSKSRGTGISPLRYLDIGMNPEWLRYYLCAKLSAKVEDIDFNPDDFMARINSDLVGKYINIASRSAKFLIEKFNGEISPSPNYGDGESVLAFSKSQADLVRNYFEKLEYNQALRAIMECADKINQYFDMHKPWAIAKKIATEPDEALNKALHDICSVAILGFRSLTIMLTPVLPQLSERVAKELFGQPAPFTWSDLNIDPTQINPFFHLMQRVESTMLDALFEPPESP